MTQRCKDCTTHKKCSTSSTATGAWDTVPNECDWFQQVPTKPTSQLSELFRLQTELNAKYGFNLDRAFLNDLYAGKWIHDYITAMSSELEELRDCIHWKHWHKEARAGRRFELHDREKAKVEIIDLLFFWICMAQAVGLTADDAFDLYKAKLKINHERRDRDMTTAEAHKHKLK